MDEVKAEWACQVAHFTQCVMLDILAQIHDDIVTVINLISSNCRPKVFLVVFYPVAIIKKIQPHYLHVLDIQSWVMVGGAGIFRFHINYRYMVKVNCKRGLDK